MSDRYADALARCVDTAHALALPGIVGYSDALYADTRAAEELWAAARAAGITRKIMHADLAAALAGARP